MENDARILNDRQAAEHVGLAVQTLRNYRALRRGPRYMKLGRAIRYRVADLEFWLKEHLIEPED